ncbi:MAG TPA: helix-turn-helix domain-containing protein [bacterium]
MEPGFRLLTNKEQEKLRQEAVQAVQQGEPPSRVARRLGVTRQAVHHWIRRYRAGGPAGLRTQPRGRRKIRPLLPWQEERVSRAILRVPPAALNVQASSWTKRAIADFVEDSFGVRLPEWIVSAYLRDWGFGPQRVVRHAFADPAARAEATVRRPAAVGPPMAQAVQTVRG